MAPVRMTTTVAHVVRAFLDDPTAAQYGFDLMQKVGISSGSLYPILARLERAGWITGKHEAIDPSAQGRPPRRYYQLTAEGELSGRQQLAALSDRLRPPAAIRIHGPAPQGGWA